MMTRRILLLLTAVVAVALVIGLGGRQSQSAKDEFHFDAATLKDTNLWTRVNAEPYRMSVAADLLCQAPTAQIYEPERKKNPHAASYITVYVNKLGQEAMFAKEIKRFPVGSIIVKQKISTRWEGSKPLLYTIMRKRDTGYNPAVGDWEFSVIGPNGKELQATGKLESCQGCHEGKQDSDHVFRPYLKTN